MLSQVERLDTTLARAFKEAEERKEREEAERAARAEAAVLAAAADHVYDPGPEPDDPSLYEGTGIGALYGLPGCERFLGELGDWTLGKEPQC